ncbi:MAG: N-acetylglucosamine kinase [Flavobacteriaceae bacterium]|nr:N-acetylglucosamine kinase [Flavobacteriaceae bacterium]
MILIADSGSTKADWVLLNDDKSIASQSTTKGVNPAVFSESDLYKTITGNAAVIEHEASIEEIYFYSAGCGTVSARKIMQELFEEIFPNAQTTVKEDIFAAAYAVSDNREGIICILGTGSNCCYFDGKDEIITKIPSLGYILMDDASGNYFGKMALRDYFYLKMPKKLHDMFKEEYNLNPDDVKKQLYKSGNPNSYLATFAKFIIKHKNETYCSEIIKNGFSEFIENHITQHDRVYDLPIHFVGSIAYYLQDELKAALKSFRLNSGNFLQKPIDRLIEYHQNK